MPAVASLPSLPTPPWPVQLQRKVQPPLRSGVHRIRFWTKKRGKLRLDFCISPPSSSSLPSSVQLQHKVQPPLRSDVDPIRFLALLGPGAGFPAAPYQLARSGFNMLGDCSNFNLLPQLPVGRKPLRSTHLLSLTDFVVARLTEDSDHTATLPYFSYILSFAC